MKATVYTDGFVDARHNPSKDFRKLSGQIKGIKNRQERNARYKKTGLLAAELYNCEQKLYSYLKEILET